MVGSVPRKCSRFSGCRATKSAPDWLACTPIKLAALGGAPAWQARAHFLQRFPRPSWLRTALWVGKLTDSRLCDSAFVQGPTGVQNLAFLHRFEGQIAIRAIESSGLRV